YELGDPAPTMSSTRLARATLDAGRSVTLGTTAKLEAWPSPYRGGWLNVSFARDGDCAAIVKDFGVDVYDLAGRRVRALTAEHDATAAATLRWDGRDEDGVAVRDGVYFLRAQGAEMGASIRVVVMR